MSESKKNQSKYKRVLIKLSGESLAGKNKTGIDGETIDNVCAKIKEIFEMGVEIAIVVGGGNFWRGRSGVNMDRSTADHMGMLATVINSLGLQDSLERQGVPTRVQSAIEMRQIAEPYIKRKAARHLEQSRIVIFACGTGNPYFSTDTAAALRAAEIGADIFMKATNTDGIYDCDPNKYKTAVKYKEISYLDILNKELGVMDSTATSLCKDNDLPILVFDISDPGNIVRAIKGEDIGTIVR